MPRTADFSGVRRTLLDAVKTQGALATPAPEVLLDILGDSTMTISVRVAVKSADWWRARAEIEERVKSAMDSANNSGATAPA